VAGDAVEAVGLGAPGAGAGPPWWSSYDPSSQEERCFEFLLRINDHPLGIKRLPDKFTEFIDGVETA
jgi:hypothetical protein